MSEKIYIPRNGYEVKSPIDVKTTDDKIAFKLFVDFDFEWQYNYENHKGNFIDLFSKFMFVLVMIYIVILIGKFVVRQVFY